MKRFRPTLIGLTLVLLAVAGPAAATSHRTPAPKKGGHYVGTSSQGLDVSFRVDRKGKKVSLGIPEQLECSGGLGFDAELSFKTKIKKHRTFADSSSETDDLPDDPRVGSGNLTGDYTDNLSARFFKPRRRVYRRLKGKFHTHLTVMDGSGAVVHECDSDTVTFTARLVKH